jgi:hypothetical protein
MKTPLKTVIRDPVEQEYIETLQKFFKVDPLEKYPSAIINIYFEEAINHVLGKNCNKKKVGKRNKEKIYQYILHKLQVSYGKYANLTHFKMKNDRSIRFHTNFHLIFKIRDKDKNLGYLYTKEGDGAKKGIMFTSHSLDRINERMPSEIIETYKTAISKAYNCQANTLDIAWGILSIIQLFQYAIYENHYYYLNLMFGVLVLEKYDNLFIAVTFLTHDQLSLPVKWYEPLVSDEHTEFKSFSDMISYENYKIEEPDKISPKFFEEERAEKIYISKKAIKSLDKIEKEYPEEQEFIRSVREKMKDFLIRYKKALNGECSVEDLQILEDEHSELALDIFKLILRAADGQKNELKK